jgi:hypothetical protein
MYKSCKGDIKKFHSHVDLNLTNVTSSLRLGDVEYKVLSFIINKILPSRRLFRNEEVWKPLGLRKDTVSHVLRQLSEKGFLRKIATGLYETTEKLIDFINGAFKLYKISEKKKNKNNRSSQREADLNFSLTSGSDGGFASGSDRESNDVFEISEKVSRGVSPVGELAELSRERSGSVLSRVGFVSGGFVVFSVGFGRQSKSDDFFVFLDNVRGISVSGSYVYGDRGRKLSFVDVVLNMERVDYAEFGVGRRVSSVSDALLPGLFVFYSDPVAREIYFEFRPYSGVIPEDEHGSLDLGSGLRLMWSFFFRVFIELFRLLRSERAPGWVRKLVDRLLTKMCRHATEL